MREDAILISLPRDILHTLGISALELAIYWLIAVNFCAFAAFAIDKARAEDGQRRTRESTLLDLAMFGGTLGAYAGRALFRHKTRKHSFSVRLHGIACVQGAALLALAAWWWWYPVGALG